LDVPVNIGIWMYLRQWSAIMDNLLKISLFSQLFSDFYIGILVHLHNCSFFSVIFQPFVKLI